MDPAPVHANPRPSVGRPVQYRPAGQHLIGRATVNVTPLIRKSAGVAYTGLRTPFALVENRLPERSKARVGLHAVLQTIDTSVAGLLREPVTEPVAPPSEAPRATEADAPADPDADLEAEREAVAQAVRERQPDVGELADPDLDVAEVQAQLQAKHAIEAREEAK